MAYKLCYFKMKKELNISINLIILTKSESYFNIFIFLLFFQLLNTIKQKHSVRSFIQKVF